MSEAQFALWSTHAALLSSDVEFGVISITMEEHPMFADDTAEGEHVNDKEDGHND